MTAFNWFTSNDPERMLAYLPNSASPRQQRLFACACCRRIWNWFTDQRSRVAVEVAERFADKQASVSEVVQLRDEIYTRSFDEINTRSFEEGQDEIDELTEERNLETPASVEYSLVGTLLADPLGVNCLGVTQFCCWLLGHAVRSGRLLRSDQWFGNEDWWQGEAEAVIAEERQPQAHLLRDIFSNFFRSNSFMPSWLTWNDGTLPKLAQRIYDNRTFDLMPILADALTDAGCTDDAILDHCRQPGEHVRGCWVLDLLLGKE